MQETDSITQKPSKSRGELITWYLARLRNNARQNSLDRKLTPMTLVETDKTLIQEIVASSHMGIEQKSNKILKELRLQNKNIRLSQSLLILLSALGTLIILFLLVS